MEFKTLTHLGQFVEPNLLEEGIYLRQTPQLYSLDTTIEALIERANNVRDMTGIIISENYFENLQKCELSLVKLDFIY